MAALGVLICCCLALIIFVRNQVRKTEQGTEIQKYIRRKKQSMDSNNQLNQEPLPDPVQLAPQLVPSQSNLHALSINPVLKAVSISRSNLTPTPGGPVTAGREDLQKELYLVKIAQQNEMKQKFQNMDKQYLYENQADEDEDFGANLNDAMQLQQSEENKMFNDMASEQYRNEMNQMMQRQHIHHHHHQSTHQAYANQYN